MKKIKIISTLIFVFFACNTCIKAQEIKTSIYYSTDQSNLSKNSKIKLDSLCLRTNKTDKYMVYISGYTDSIASNDYNLELSKKRVKGVCDYLISKNINQSNIICNYYGENKPLNKNSDSIMRQKNRRVDIVLKFPDKTFSGGSGTSNTDSIKKIGSKKVFENDTTIFCQMGAEIEIKCGTFYPYKIKDINFNIKEYYSRCDMINSNLTMKTTTGDCLTSGGVLFIKPTVDTLEIQPNNGYKIRVKIPAENNILDKSMNVYYAKMKNGEVIWQPTTVELSYITLLGIGYYVFEIDSLVGINIDKPIQVRCEENGPLVKIKGYNAPYVYLTYPNQMYLSKGIVVSGKTFSLVKVAVDKKPTLTVIAEKNGIKYIATGPLLALEYKSRKNTYIVKRKYFHIIELVPGKKETDIEAALCNSFSSKDK